jgi:23S rRNA U2552 (ribose-2'-O)-methylase RlmE/FtsJ
MEITIFKKNEIKPDLFTNQTLSYKYVEYSDISELKNNILGDFQHLDLTKCKIDTLDKNTERLRRAAAKYLHEYELIKIICKKQVSSRAYFKLYEMIYNNPLIELTNLNCFFICEAPGGFIECVSDIRRKRNLRTNYLSISKNNDIKYDRYLEESNLIYGDILDISNIDKTINTTLLKFPTKLDLVTADGGFDIKLFNGQEVISSKLLLCEIYLALSTQKHGGTFIIKFFDMFTHNSIVFYLILCSLYKSVKIIKPYTSRNCNSERYLICESFEGIGLSKILDDIRECIINFAFSDSDSESMGVNTIIYPNLRFDLIPNFIKKIHSINSIILSEQIKTINESIKMISSKDIYFQNLILKLFIEKNTISYLFFYKNILNSRIKRCISFLRKHSINTNQLAYRFE